MIEWSRFDKEPTAETLKDYPTILDILKDIVAQEEEEQLHKLPLNREWNDYFYDWSRTGHYLMMYDRQQRLPVLLPTSRTAFTFFRGQSVYHEQCLPSLYRYKGKRLKQETLRSQLQTAEMILLMKSHPVIMSIESGGILHEKLGLVKLPVIYDGLAQHYGIKTCYLDLTNDIWCAAFFAATTYDGAYHPFEVKGDMPFEKRYGVLYKFEYKKGDQDFSKDDILPIGLQYFNRPGKQSALVIAMQDLRDLHKHPKLERVFFRHDTEVSRLIFTLSQFGKQFITDDDPFAKMVESICAEDKYSQNAVMLAQRIYHPGMTFESFVEEVKRQKFEVVEKPRVAYPEELFAKEFDEWKHGGADRYINRIIIPAMTMIPLEDLQGYEDIELDNKLN